MYIIYIYVFLPYIKTTQISFSVLSSYIFLHYEIVCACFLLSETL